MGWARSQFLQLAVCVSLSSRANFLWSHCYEDMFVIRPGFDSATSYNTALPHLFWLEAVSSEWHIQRWREDRCCPLHRADPSLLCHIHGLQGMPSPAEMTKGTGPEHKGCSSPWATRLFLWSLVWHISSCNQQPHFHMESASSQTGNHVDVTANYPWHN